MRTSRLLTALLLSVPGFAIADTYRIDPTAYFASPAAEASDRSALEADIAALPVPACRYARSVADCPLCDDRTRSRRSGGDDHPRGSSRCPGRRVGTVIDTAHIANGNVSALLVQLDSDKIVWIDVGDVRYNRADGIIMTNLDRADLRHMADQRV